MRPRNNVQMHRERAPRELRVKTRRVVIQPGDESTWLTSSRVILGF